MRILRDYSLAWVLLALFLVSWAGQAWSEWEEYEAEQAAHGAEAKVGGGDGYAVHFTQSTLENWQSEFLQLLTFVVLTAYLAYKGSPESRTSDEETQAALERIEKRLKALDQAVKEG